MSLKTRKNGVRSCSIPHHGTQFHVGLAYVKSRIDAVTSVTEIQEIERYCTGGKKNDMDGQECSEVLLAKLFLLDSGLTNIMISGP